MEVIQMRNFKKDLKKGFTIIELAIVIAVIAILAAVFIPTFTGIVNSARESAAYQECRIALTTYIADGKSYDAQEGMVFAHGKHEYVYVYLNGELCLVGKFNDLSHLNSNGKLTEGKNHEAFDGRITFPGTGITNKFNLGFDEDSTDPVTLDTEEAIYFYLFTSEEDKTYVGYFVMDMNALSGSEYKINNCAYSLVGEGRADAHLTVTKDPS